METIRVWATGACACLVAWGAVPFWVFGGWPAVAQEAPFDFRTGLRWFEQAAAAGDAEAQYRLGSILERGADIAGAEGEPGVSVPPDLESAVRWFGAAADQGHPLAQLKLGLIHQSGRLGSIDLVEARRWYEAAAGQGLPQAQFNLAVLLAAQDVELSRVVDLYRRAARAGFAPAAYELGLLYRNGTGVTIDPIEAYVWLERAVRMGHHAAKPVRDEVFEALSGSQRAEAARRLAEPN